MIRVIMAVNGSSGRNNGRIERIDFEAGTDLLLSLEWSAGDAFCPYENIRGERSIYIDTELYNYTRYGTWAGSMAFDCAELTDAVAERLVKDLQAMYFWNCIEAVEGFYEAWENGDPIRFSDVEVIDYVAQERAGQKRLPGMNET